MSPNEEASAVDREWIEFGAGRSNTIVLSESEACVAKALLEEVQGHSNRLTLEISPMPANLDDLKARNEAVAARIDRLQTALAPHKRLPSELLSTIFFDTLDSGRAILVPDSPAESWPWPLRTVCSRWRDVAVSDIRLWDSVTCRMQKWDTKVGESLASVLQSITALCKAAPSRLEIDIHRYTDHGLEGYVQFEPFHLNSFPPLPTPITGISLSLPPLCLIQFFHSSSSKFPSLTSLSLDLQHVRPMDHLLTELFYGASFFDDAHSLRKLTIRSSQDLSEIYIRPRIPWSQLTKLDFSGQALSALSVLQVLRQCRQLVVCLLWVEHDYFHFPPLQDIRIENVAMPHLRSLMVRGKILEGNHFFARLLVPSLAELHFTMEYQHTFTDLSGMIHRSRASLKIFEYDSNETYISPEPSELEDFLENTPSLAEFDAFLEIPRSTLRRVSRGELLSRLEVLKCVVAIDDLDALVAIFVNRKKRTGHLYALREVLIRVGEEGRESRLERLRSLKEAYRIDFAVGPLYHTRS
ncbi:hypothetical protein Hypma_004480 [Hypsizygus marmoreus]|uniref:Uncharacterized protein n=1 Tax=Hypsizygus marmoreus TaxID=39966 RepID=A0A369K3Z2_HYPMA|nr:hypothetical protein Hypma_004480 [Hypsizygus marmoreus]